MTNPFPKHLKTALALFLCLSQTTHAFEETSWNNSSDTHYSHYNSSNAHFYEEPCCENQSNLTISEELIYFKPTREQSSYVITSTSNVVGGEFFPNGTRHLNSMNYKPGFRVGAVYDPCGDSNALDFRFTYFSAGHSASTSGDFLFDTIGFPGDGAQAPEDTFYVGTASIHDHYKYYAVDATFNRLSLCSLSDSLFLLIGLHYANIQHNTRFTSVGSFTSSGSSSPVDNTLRSSSKFWGIGPQFGLDYTYHLPNQCYINGQFALNANMRAALLCSNSDASFHYTTLRTARTAGVNLSNDDLWRVTPTFDARLGGTYHFCFWGLDANIELGYEWIWYADSIDSITGIDVAFAGDSIDLFSNFSLSGPFIKLSVPF